jgi:hypothetical protein
MGQFLRVNLVFVAFFSLHIVTLLQKAWQQSINPNNSTNIRIYRLFWQGRLSGQLLWRENFLSWYLVFRNLISFCLRVYLALICFAGLSYLQKQISKASINRGGAGGAKITRRSKNTKAIEGMPWLTLDPKPGTAVSSMIHNCPESDIWPKSSIVSLASFLTHLHHQVMQISPDG